MKPAVQLAWLVILFKFIVCVCIKTFHLLTHKVNFSKKITFILLHKCAQFDFRYARLII